MKIKHLILAVCGAMIITSCLTPKTVAYFPELADGASLEMTYTKGILLKPTDKLSIVVNTKSAELNNVLNLPVTSQIIGYSELQSTNQSRGTSGYTIDPEGYIDFPLIGKFSVIGEVKEPGFYEIKSDRTTLMQALSRAGDMTIYGDRNKVKVLRINDEGKQDTYVLSMMEPEALTKSPAYIIQQNDVVYVQPNNYRKRQSANASDTSNGSFWVSVVSVLTTIAVLLFK